MSARTIERLLRIAEWIQFLASPAILSLLVWKNAFGQHTPWCLYWGIVLSMQIHYEMRSAYVYAKRLRERLEAADDDNLGTDDVTVD